MSCYICLEEENLMEVKGCDCKGSISIHKACLDQWIQTTDNPFQCTVCKGDYNGTFLTHFLSEEEILFHPAGNEVEEEREIWYDFHGIRIVSTESDLYFDSEYHKSIYFQTIHREDKALRLEMRHKNAVRFHNKHRIRARQNHTSRK